MKLKNTSIKTQRNITISKCLSCSLYNVNIESNPLVSHRDTVHYCYGCKDLVKQSILLSKVVFEELN